MNGYFGQSAGPGSDRMSKGVLNINVTNVKEFKALIDEAKKRSLSIK